MSEQNDQSTFDDDIPDTGGVVSKEQILTALSTINDPDLNRDIVSLGFIKRLRVCGTNVAFDIELTTPACPVREQMQQAAQDVVSELPGVERVAITMTAQTRQIPAVRNLIPGVKNAIAVASGKGGVGKSTTAVNLAIALAQTGAQVGLLDADIYGPSIPIMLGVPEGEQPMGTEENGVQMIFPIERWGIKLMSIGFLTEKENPIIWRGPMVGKMIQTFLGTVLWGELDYLIIDLPPGTGDTQLTLVQSAPLSGAVIVTTPEQVAIEDVMRAGRMFEKMGQQGTPVPILGIVENMSWFETPQGERIELFGSGGGARAAQAFGVPLLGQVPRQLEITRGGDAGAPICATQPDSPAAQIYHEIAGGVARHVATLAMQGQRGFEEGRALKTMEELVSRKGADI
ncbi:MAG: ATP-binding protein involved in chromosome partitioning [Abditibacteriota bacterium]|nr:ATP-binding protein involved in chromosome partitioning [Abditibacteriota bacterium]